MISFMTVQPYLQRRFDRLERRARFHGRSTEDAVAWQTRARAKLAELLGLETMLTCEPEVVTGPRVDAGDHFRERIELSVEPGVRMPVYVLTPKSVKPPYPVVIAAHGHGGGGKAAVAGVDQGPEIESKIAKYNYGYGPLFCRAGFLVFCPEARGFGERREARSQDDTVASSCLWINHMALTLGQTVAGMWVWDLQRLIDYIETRDDCDATRIGCAGLSGGGLQSMWTAAIDTRVAAAVNSGYFYGFKEALLDKYHNCSCNYVPHLCEHFDMGDIAGLIAPRPFMAQAGTEDSHNGASGIANVESQAALTRNVYRAHRAEDRFALDLFEGPHRWDSTRTIPFMTQMLGNA